MKANEKDKLAAKALKSLQKHGTLIVQVHIQQYRNLSEFYKYLS